MGKGHFLISGYYFHVVDIKLKNRKVEILGEYIGVIPEISGVATVFDEDGLGCWQGSNVIHIPANDNDNRQMWVHLEMQVVEVLNAGVDQ